MAHTDTITDEDVRGASGGGNAYSQVSSTHVSSLSEKVKGQVDRVYDDALRLVWYVCLAFSSFALLITLLEKEVVMRTTHDAPQERTTEKGLKDLESEGSTHHWIFDFSFSQGPEQMYIHALAERAADIVEGHEYDDGPDSFYFST